MLIADFDEEKDIFLKQSRGVGFEDILEAIDRGGLLADLINPNKKYPHQRILIVKITNYAYVVPYVQDKKGVSFLKTIYPSRIFTKIYIK